MAKPQYFKSAKDILLFFAMFILQIDSVICQVDETWSLEKVATESLDSTLVWLSENYMDDSKDYHQIALFTIARSYQTQDDRLIGDAHNVLNEWHGQHTLFNVDSTLFHAEKTLFHYQKTGDQRKIAKVYNNLAEAYLRNSFFDKSQNAAFEAIKRYEELGDEQGVAIAYKYFMK
jgi:hypothetical protein